MTFFKLKRIKERNRGNSDENMSSTKKGTQLIVLSSQVPYMSQASLGLISTNAATTIKSGSRYWTRTSDPHHVKERLCFSDHSNILIYRAILFFSLTIFCPYGGFMSSVMSRLCPACWLKINRFLMIIYRLTFCRTNQQVKNTVGFRLLCPVLCPVFLLKAVGEFRLQ